MTAPSTRGPLRLHLLPGAPASEYTAKNSVPDGAIPDVGSADAYCARNLYVLTGGYPHRNDRYGTFLPASNIRAQRSRRHPHPHVRRRRA
jgi:hypothetical protein